MDDDMELSLGETTDTDSRDVTAREALTPEGFDLTAWMAGIRPSRRATTIYGRPDLLATIDVLSERVIEAQASRDTEETVALMAQIREARDAMSASAVDVVVEASSEQAQADLRTALGIKEGADLTEDQVLGWIAAHIVAPEGFDTAALKALNAVSPRQVAKIGNAVRVANETAPAVPAPFSPASSNGRRARG